MDPFERFRKNRNEWTLRQESVPVNLFLGLFGINENMYQRFLVTNDREMKRSQITNQITMLDLYIGSQSLKTKTVIIAPGNNESNKICPS